MNWLKKVGNALLLIPLAVIAIVVLAVMALCTPINFLRYRRSPYYRAFRKKYTWYITQNTPVQLYNRIVRQNLPMEYVQNDEATYVVRDGEVLFVDWLTDELREEDGVWREGDQPLSAHKDTLAQSLREEHRALSTRLLLLYDDVSDADLFEAAKACSDLYCVDSLDELCARVLPPVEE